MQFLIYLCFWICNSKLEDNCFRLYCFQISDLEGIDKTTHGFSKDGIPEAKDVVRIDVMGGFAIQKVTSERSYFR